MAGYVPRIDAILAQWFDILVAFISTNQALLDESARRCR